MAVDGRRTDRERRQAAAGLRADRSLARVVYAFARVLRLEPKGARDLRRRQLDERALMAPHRERALHRVAVAAADACEDWSRGGDLDVAMTRLRAELRTAAEFGEI
jgi:hypothetical protein